MTSKQMKFESAAHAELMNGVRKLADAVAVTMGPCGHNVVMDKSYGGPTVTRDGVSVAKEVDLPQKFENMGAKMVQEVAKKTAEVAGDGTTAATVLACAILENGLKHTGTGANAVAIQRGINAAAKVASEAIHGMAVKCKGKSDLEKIATVSANQDKAIGSIIAEAVDQVGAEGVVEVEESKTGENHLDYVEGMAFDKGYLSPYFMTDPTKAECILENPMILIHEKKISNLADLLPLLNKVATAGKPLLIIAEEVENEALAALVVNRLRGVLEVCAVKAPGFGDRRKAMLEDIAVLTGGYFFSEDIGRNLEDVELKELGSARKVVITKDDTTMVEGAGKKKDITARATQIRNLYDNSTSDYVREKLQERLAKLPGGVAIISVGAQTELEMKERKDRVDDALHATRAAAKEGYVPGGGVSFVRAISAVEDARRKGKGDEKLGYDILCEAMRNPICQIANNAGIDGDLVFEKVSEGKGGFGFNAATGKYEDLTKAGIIDPALVSTTSLRNAASVAGLMLTTNVIITELEGDDEPVNGAVN
jgi:chaperonin GroEL